MEYITIKRFREECLAGEANIPYGTQAQEQGGVIFCRGVPICYIDSQNALDYFARNDDGQGLRRGELVQEIVRRLEKKDALYQDRWNAMWADERANRLRRKEHADHWIWSVDFYNAPVSELERILKILKGVR